MTLRERNLTWSADEVGHALEALVRHCGLASSHATISAPRAEFAETPIDTMSRWIESAAVRLGVEAEPAEESYARIEQMLRAAGPALLYSEAEHCFLAIVRGSQKEVMLLAPDGDVRSVPLQEVRAWLCHALEAPERPIVDRVLTGVAIHPKRMESARRALLRERLATRRIGGCWMLRPAPHAPLWQHIRMTGLSKLAAVMTGSYFIHQALFILAWWLIGWTVLRGQADIGWLVGWVMLLLAMVPLRILMSWTQGRLALGAAGVFKQRLLYGALRLEPEDVRREGAGRVLGRVMESSAIESLALGAGMLAIAAIIDLIFVFFVLGAGPLPLVQTGLFVGWMAVGAILMFCFVGRRKAWTENRLSMTNDFIERLLGHRTRLAQESPDGWHNTEDQALDAYYGVSRRMDRFGALLTAVSGRGWMLIGLSGLGIAFVGAATTPAMLAVGLGGVLLAGVALAKLNGSLSYLVDAWISWGQVAPVFHAARRAEEAGTSAMTMTSASEASGEAPPGDKVVLEGHRLAYRYRDRIEPVLRDCDLQLRADGRVLLEGPSGSGKSTLGALLCGLRSPQSGILLLDGLDRATWGADGWRRRVAGAPQFHENYVLTGSFAFNLLMGRNWPPSDADLAEAETVCRELGLGDLLDRMPAGLRQQIGESGWQLSHGEQSRLFVARALLQGADTVILDESFAALDPQTLAECLKCVHRRARSLILIAHP